METVMQSGTNLPAVREQHEDPWEILGLNLKSDVYQIAQVSRYKKQITLDC